MLFWSQPPQIVYQCKAYKMYYSILIVLVQLYITVRKQRPKSLLKVCKCFVPLLCYMSTLCTQQMPTTNANEGDLVQSQETLCTVSFSRETSLCMSHSIHLWYADKMVIWVIWHEKKIGQKRPLKVYSNLKTCMYIYPY